MINCFFNNFNDAKSKFNIIVANEHFFRAKFINSFHFIYNYPFVLTDDMNNISLRIIGFAIQAKNTLNDSIINQEFDIFIEEFNASLKPINEIRLEKLKKNF